MPDKIKQSLREDFKKRREDLGKKGRADASRHICTRLQTLPQYKLATGIAAYWPLADEINIRPVIKAALHAGLEVYLPRVVPGHKFLEFCPFNGDPTTLAPGPFDLQEPTTAPVPIKSTDLIIIPGLAFDMHRHRLGYGTGYYDRFLKSVDATRMGVAFDVTTIDIMPVAEHDVPMDLLVTETRLL